MRAENHISFHCILDVVCGNGLAEICALGVQGSSRSLKQEAPSVRGVVHILHDHSEDWNVSDDAPVGSRVWLLCISDKECDVIGEL